MVNSRLPHDQLGGAARPYSAVIMKEKITQEEILGSMVLLVGLGVVV
jgi:hypothetical protein